MSNNEHNPEIPNARAQFLQCVFGPMRVPFLALPLACVFLGIVTAARTAGHLSVLHILLVFIGGVTAHISVNALNEYCDFRSDLDTRTDRTLFSGGSGTLPEHPQMAWVALATGLVTLAITAGIGLFFLILHGLALLPIGLLGLVIIIIYTPNLTHQPALCLIAPGLGFGPLMVVGTQVALTGHATALAWIVSLVPFFLVNDLLLLNQFPDAEADRSVGRKHVLVVLGPRRCSVIYTLFLAAAYVTVIAGVILKWLPLQALLGLATVLIAIPTARGVMRYQANVPQLIPYLGRNVVINLATPALLAAGLLLAR